jgi:hypothetical protein
MAWAAGRRESKEGVKGRRMGKANGSRERAPDDRLRVPTTQIKALNLSVGGHGARSAFANPA